MLKPPPGTLLNMNHQVNKGLLACLPMNNRGSRIVSGNIASDISGNNRHGLLKAGAVFVPSKNGGSVLIGPTNNRIVANTITVPAGSDYTFFIRVYILAFVGTSPGLWRSDVDAKGVDWNIVNVNRRPWARVAGTDIFNPSTGFELVTDIWYDLAYVIKSGVGAEFWVNGKLEHSGSNAQAVAEFIVNIFGYQSSVSSRVSGLYDEIRFYNRAVSANEIKQLYEIRLANSLELYALDPIEQWAWVPVAGGYVLKKNNSGSGVLVHLKKNNAGSGADPVIKYNDAGTGVAVNTSGS